MAANTPASLVTVLARTRPSGIGGGDHRRLLAVPAAFDRLMDPLDVPDEPELGADALARRRHTGVGSRLLRRGLLGSRSLARRRRQAAKRLRNPAKRSRLRMLRLSRANPKAESQSPAASAGTLTAAHFAVGDKITTKGGKTGVVTHIRPAACHVPNT
jgi:hypothetical protein